MNILVTGGSVFVSRAVAEWFTLRGERVFVLNRGSRPNPDGTQLIRADRHNPGDVLKSYCFDAVLDMTAYTGADVRQLTDALGDFGCYILLSSSAVYPETLPQPFRTSQQTGFNSHWGDYGAGKIEAEETILRTVKDAYIIRPPYLCGRGNNLYREAFIFECAEAGIPVCLPEGIDLQLQFCDISELCRLIEALIVREPNTHILNVGAPDTVSAEEWARICFLAAGRKPDIRYVSSDAPLRSCFPFRNYNYLLDVSETLPISPYQTALADSVADGFAYWKHHPGEVIRRPYIDYIMTHYLQAQ